MQRSIKEDKEAHRPKYKHWNDGKGEVAKENLSPGYGVPEFSHHDLVGTIPRPRATQSKLRIKISAEGPYKYHLPPVAAAYGAALGCALRTADV